MAGPFDSWLATRSLATWRIRVIQSSENALKLANFLESRSEKVSKVYIRDWNPMLCIKRQRDSFRRECSEECYLLI